MAHRHLFCHGKGGNEGDKNTLITYLATEGPAVSSFCRNKQLLGISTRSDQCWMLVRDPKRQGSLKKLVIPSWPFLKHINTHALRARERML